MPKKSVSFSENNECLEFHEKKYHAGKVLDLTAGVISYYNEDGELHSENDLPAVEDCIDYKAWYKEDKLHRIGSYAIIDRYFNRVTKKRETYRIWCFEGLIHRGPENDPNYDDSPALEYLDNNQSDRYLYAEWWTHGVNDETKTIRTIDDIFDYH